MNLLQIATWIQEGYKQYYNTPLIARPLLGPNAKKRSVMRYVMNKGRGHLNPDVIEQLIDMENSVEDLLIPGSLQC